MRTSAQDPPTTARYLEIAGELQRLIEAGELPAGARVPSTRAIVDRWGVAMATATKVLAELHHRGLVRAVPGVGTVVEGGRQPAPPAPDVRSHGFAPRRQSGGEGGLTPERIVAAGIAIADAEGLVAVSMRRVASELGVATMSLYRHVQDKDDLLLQMMDAALRDWRFPADPPAGWRAQVELAARMFWQACRTHPWLASAMSITRPRATAGALPFSEFLLTALDSLGLDHHATFTAYLSVINHVRGIALNLELEAEAEAATGVDNEQWMTAQEPQLRELIETGSFPVFTRYVSRDYDFSLENLFEFGLGRMLDGLAALPPQGRGEAP